MTKILDRKVRTPSVVGLDIGSSAVRAAEVGKSRRAPVLQRFAQVGLPFGAVVDGEIVDPGTVVTALRRLWSEGGFSTRNVVLAISGQRVIVRQAEVVSMPEGDFRSALRFQAMDLIPMPIDDAILDFVILPQPEGETKQGERMQILLAAAHRGVVESHLAVLREASLRAVAIDPAPMAAVRATIRAGVQPDLTTAIADIGADLTLVAVREAGRVRFSRLISTGGSDLTKRLASRLEVDQAQAEGLKRHGSLDGGRGSLLVDEVDPLVTQIESSLAFFASQLGRAPDSLLVTGGASRGPALMTELTRRVSGPVDLLDALAGVDCSNLDLDNAAMTAASSTALLSLGAAEWALDQPSKRVSLLPREMAVAARARRILFALAAAVVVLAAGLTALTLDRSHQVAGARSQAAAVVAANLGIQRRITALSSVTQSSSAIEARLAVLQLDGSNNVAWGQLIDEIGAALPPGSYLSSITLTGDGGSTSGSSSASSAPTGGSTVATSGLLGSVSMSVQAHGTLDQVAVWLRAFQKVRGLYGVSVTAATYTKGVTAFTSTIDVTTDAPMVKRPAQEGTS